MQKIILITILIFSLVSCHMKSQEIDYTQFKELHEHQGSKNYEIVEIIPTQNQASYFQVDTISKNVFVNSFFEPKSKRREEMEYDRLRLDMFGTTKDKGFSEYLLKDGTMWNSEYYSNWVINGDTTRHSYIRLLSEKEEKDPEKWLEKFKELYTKSTYVYESSWEYFFKVEKKWYMLPYNLDVINDNFVNNLYPVKEDKDIRMVELQNLAPIFYYGKPEELDTHLIKRIDYESTYFKEVDKGLNKYNFSAGWWFLEVYMPLGDTLRIKRYSNYEDPELMLYEIPSAYGGREDVLFIVQNPEEIFMSQVGGMYVIRPKDPEQPQRRYKKIIYKRNENGERVIDAKLSEESDEYKAWKVNKK